MKLTDSQLEELEDMSSALLPPIEIAILLGIDSSDRKLFCECCKNHEDSSIYYAYQKGKLKTKYELRKTVVKLAKAGSPAAEPLADKYLIEQLNKEKYG